MAVPTPEELRGEYLLDPEIAYLNHGSFGACPRPVFERYQSWQQELESEPVDFLDRRLPDLLDAARAAVAEYVGCSPADLAFVQNATTGVNLAACSIALGAEDEVLATDLEYGACDLAWEWVCRRAGARYVRAPIPLPLRDPSEVVEALFAAASERTRAVYVSHVTSSTGLLLPLEEIVERARSLGVATVVDGAHAPGHVPLNITELDVDYYSGNAHKWLGAPKGAGFIHVRPGHQACRRGRRRLGLWRGKHVLAADRGARDARSRGVAHRPGRDPLPGRPGLGRRQGAQPPAGPRSAHGAMRAPRHGPSRSGVDVRPDGRRPAPRACARAFRPAVRATPRRDPRRRPRRRSVAPLRRRLHDPGGRRSAASRPRWGA